MRLEFEAGSPLAPGIVLVLLMTLALGACAGTQPPTLDVPGSTPSVRGYRAFFSGESRGDEGRTRFRMAAAIVPPNRIRLEFFGRVGGPRLIVATDGTMVTALIPPRRIYDRREVSPQTMEHLLGVPLGATRLIALLTGQPMCRWEATIQLLKTRAAATFGRTLDWFEIECPPGDIRYRAFSKERGGLLERATVREGISGDMILEVEYGDHLEGETSRWPRQIRLQLKRMRSTVTLKAIEGPVAGDVAEDIFAPRIPESFERRPGLLSLPAPGLLGPTAEGE